MSTGRSPLPGLYFALLTAFFVLTTASHAADNDARLPEKAEDVDALTTGDKAPAFTVRTVDNEPYRFDPARLESPTILISFRGGWCPYCNLHLSELRTAIPELSDMGYDVLFLSGDRPDMLYSSLKRETRADIEGLEYRILSDADIEAARALGTAFRTSEDLTAYLDKNDRDYEGSSIGKHHALAVPAVYVIRRDGIIAYDFVNPDYKVRLSADKLLAAARKAL